MADFFRHFHGMGGGPGMGNPFEERQELREWCSTLGVGEGCSPQELKRAWRSFVKTNHPDRGGDPEYFRKGEAANAGLQKRMERRGTVGRTQLKKPEEIEHHLSIDLEDVHAGNGKEIEITIRTASSRKVCGDCDGKGRVVQMIRRGPMIMQTQAACPACDGQGISYDNEQKIKKTIEVFIPSGVKEGDKVVQEDVGHELAGMAVGDVACHIHIKPHALYKRLQADLAMTKELTLMQALAGFDFTIPSIVKGEWLRVRSEPGQIIQPGDVICIAEKGVAQKGNRSCRGNLFIRFSVTLPEHGSFDEGQVAALQNVLSPKNVKYTMPGDDYNETREFEVGSKIRLVGLQNKPDLNGKEGIIIQEDIQGRPGQYAVRLSTGQTVAVRDELLEFATKQKQSKKKKGPKKNQYVEDISGDKVEDPENINHTPYKEGTMYDEDEERNSEEEGVRCRQM